MEEMDMAVYSLICIILLEEKNKKDSTISQNI